MASFVHILHVLYVILLHYIIFTLVTVYLHGGREAYMRGDPEKHMALQSDIK